MAPKLQTAGPLVVFSHLRWDGVWQRPQHVVSRLAHRATRTLFVEEPLPAPVAKPNLRVEQRGPVTRVILEIPQSLPPANGRWHTFGDDGGADHAGLVRGLMDEGPATAWLYSPLALPIATSLEPEVLVYDVMDDLASFKGASPETRLRQAQALAEAHVVFTGGRSLHESVLEHRRRPDLTLCLPSGVDIAHFAVALEPHERPVAGYVGVIDERIDLELVRGMAERLPDWIIRMVGPVTKIDEAALPQAPNIEYLGKREYADLPGLMAGFDVALMPFALNEATRAISPTKTMEYLAAGLPVVSTAIRDVVRDCGEVVTIAADAEGFAAACVRFREGYRPAREIVDALLQPRRWEVIVGDMVQMLDARRSPAVPGEVSA